MDEALTEDTLLGGRVRLAQPRHGFRAAVDPVLLAAFVPARPGDAVLELGCGSGAAFLCLAARVPGVTVTALERDASLAELATRNASANGVAATVLTGDLREARLPEVAHGFANPPFWPGGTPSPNSTRRQASHEQALLVDWVTALGKAVRTRGTASLVLPASRFAEASSLLRSAGFGAVSLCPLWPRVGVAAKRVLLRAVKGGRGPDAVLPGLVLHAGTSWSATADAVLREGAALPVNPPDAR
ncbi:tRNA1(Val) (adenine(37)-N6)-methyltransferase [Sabulicella glaciei]|uniref:Methyltransferase n=1 Tax=Sabulicella glaciei TaxID=2984948 RepID=A0ABT3NRV1_9PROT|nr:methyltransferase [Roseococcus sp. MDT2-1-1]MCW8084309.1 methyltransferase [Roseococcus sp. MDT2-1-1]